MLNKVTLIGRVGKEPESRYTSSGDPVVSLTLATSESWKNKAGEKQEKTEWHNLTAFRSVAEIISEYVHKGDLLYVEGKIQTRKWQDKEGKDRYSTEILVAEIKMLGGKKASSEGEDSKSFDIGYKPKNAKPTPPTDGGFDTFDDDVPF